MKRIIILLLNLLMIFLIVPVNALDMAVLSFEENLDESSFVLTADQTKVLVTSFSVDKNSIEEVPVYINSVTNLSGLKISVEYDKGIISPENISGGNFNITYFIEEDLQVILDLNESFTGDFLLAKIYFRAIGEEGKSTSLTIWADEFLDSYSNEIPYLTVDGMFSITIKDIEGGTERYDGNEGLGGDLGGLMNAENRSKFAEENNLELDDDKVRVIIETENSIEDLFVDIDNLPDLLNNETIKSIRPYKTMPKELIIISLILLLIVIFLVILRFKKRK